MPSFVSQRLPCILAALAALVVAGSSAGVAPASGAQPVARAATPVTAQAARSLQRSCTTTRRSLAAARRALRRSRPGTGRRATRSRRVKRLSQRSRRVCKAARAARVKPDRPAPAKPAPAAPTKPGSRAAWSDDFEGAGWGAWDDLNGNNSSQDRYFQKVADPTGAPGRAFQATVDAAAVDDGEAGQRSLATLNPARVPEENRSGAFQGSDQWYHARIYFPQSFVPARNTDWNWVLEWHNWPDGPCCANLAITVDTDPTRGSGERLTLRSMGGGSPEHPADREDPYSDNNPTTHDDHIVGDPALRRDHWYDVVMHVKWSYRSNEGLVEWWLDGRLVTSRQTSTLYWYGDGNSSQSGAQPGPGQAYIQAGYYRDNRLLSGAIDTSSMSVFHDDYRRGPTRESIGV